ncbi:MAG: ATP-binding cassette domain-containing protein [Lachnospiraceae bacterium]
MYISGLSICNRFIHVQDIHLDFKKNGIYFITGENGCGKTTLLEQILFGNHGVCFESREEQYLYEHERFNLFTYCPQKIVVNELKVKEYIRKMNRGVDEDQMSSYLLDFGFTTDVLEQRFYTLSGGEQMKISFICGLLKNTPYLFLDEPTNYLDNTAVKELMLILEAEAHRKRIVIVSHDSRLQFREACVYKFCNNTVMLQSDTRESFDREESMEKQKCSEGRTFGCNRLPGVWKMITGLTRNYAYAVTFIIISYLLAAIITITNLGFYSSVNSSSFPEEGAVFAYDMDYHDSLNSYYEEAEGLVVDESLYACGITFEDIGSIAGLDGVTDIYIVDDMYLYQLDCYLGFVPGEEYQPEGDVFLLSCPERMLNNYLECSHFNPYLQYTQGELPKDGAGQVAISKKLLIELYGYTEETVEDALGDSISLYNYLSGKEQEYTIVGFSYYDFAFVSYMPDENYGVYLYNDTTFSQFASRLTAFLKEYGMSEKLTNVMVELDKKSERDVLNYCFMNFPSCCYYSHYYSKTFANRQLRESFMQWLVINLAFSGILALVVWIVNWSGIKYNMRLIWDIGNYYMNRKKIMLCYIGVMVMEYVLLAVLMLIVNTILGIFPEWINRYIILDSVIILLPILLSCMQAYKEANK